jgi:hypothetical protein
VASHTKAQGITNKSTNKAFGVPVIEFKIGCADKRALVISHRKLGV